jgi:hypothetical protein
VRVATKSSLFVQEFVIILINLNLKVSLHVRMLKKSGKPPIVSKQGIYALKQTSEQILSQPVVFNVSALALGTLRQAVSSALNSRGRMKKRKRKRKKKSSVTMPA